MTNATFLLKGADDTSCVEAALGTCSTLKITSYLCQNAPAELDGWNEYGILLFARRCHIALWMHIRFLLWIEDADRTSLRNCNFPNMTYLNFAFYIRTLEHSNVSRCQMRQKNFSMSIQMHAERIHTCLNYSRVICWNWLLFGIDSGCDVSMFGDASLWSRTCVHK